MTKSNLTTDQQKKLQEIGSNLQRIRIAKEVSLDSVAAKTHISKRLLEAIETGDLEELPEPFYIKALVAKYARELDAPEIKLETTPAIDVTNAKSRVVSTDKRNYWFSFQLRSLHLYLMYIILVVLSAKAITVWVERPVIVEQIPVEKPPLDSEVTQAQNPSGNSNTAPAPSSVPQFVSQSSNSNSVTVGINLQERCWLKVMVDGKLAFEGTLLKGTQRQWTGTREVTIRAGNAGGVVISFNNEQKKVLGAPGEVEEITYTVN